MIRFGNDEDDEIRHRAWAKSCVDNYYKNQNQFKWGPLMIEKNIDKRTIQQCFIHHRSLLARGQTEISLLWGAIQMGVLLWLALRDMFTIPRAYVFWMMPVIILAGLTVQYLIGWFWEYKKLINELQQWDSERNPIIKDIQREVRK